MTQESKPKYMWTIPLTAYLQFWHKDINYNQAVVLQTIDRLKEKGEVKKILLLSDNCLAHYKNKKHFKMLMKSTPNLIERIYFEDG